ncbi:MAG TPA: hypothetical protein PK373_01370 [Sedimentisphaerales bacterium]|nr:hypothetical protein [Sedimentisphaerales bacterium]
MSTVEVPGPCWLAANRFRMLSIRPNGLSIRGSRLSVRGDSVGAPGKNASYRTSWPPAT